MRKFIGTLLTWLLLLAIPLQGQTATAVLFCSAGHHGVLAQAGVHLGSNHHGGMVATANSSKSEWTAGDASGDDKCSAYSVIVGAPAIVSLLDTVAESIPFDLESFVNYISNRHKPPPRAFLT